MKINNILTRPIYVAFISTAEVKITFTRNLKVIYKIWVISFFFFLQSTWYLRWYFFQNVLNLKTWPNWNELKTKTFIWKSFICYDHQKYYFIGWKKNIHFLVKLWIYYYSKRIELLWRTTVILNYILIIWP